MPISRKRAKRPVALAGIPSNVLAKAPANLSTADRAKWTRCYMDGREGLPFRRPDQDAIDRTSILVRYKAIEKSPSWARRAYQIGKAERG